MSITIFTIGFIQIIRGLSWLFISLFGGIEQSIDNAKKQLQKYREILTPEKLKRMDNYKRVSLLSIMDMSEAQLQMQVRGRFLAGYFIHSIIDLRTSPTRLSAFLFALANCLIGLAILLNHFTLSWWIGVLAILYILLREFHVVVTLPFILKTFENSRVYTRSNSYYSKHFTGITFYTAALLYFFSQDVLVYFNVNLPLPNQMMIFFAGSVSFFIFLDLILGVVWQRTQQNKNIV
jgi:hypothetical protein